MLAALLARPLTLPTVRGSALYLYEEASRVSRAAPACASGASADAIDAGAAGVLARAFASGRPQVTAAWREPGDRGLSLRRGAAVAPPRAGDRRAGPRGRRARSLHRARRPLPRGPGPAGGRRAGERRSVHPTAGADRRAGPALRPHDRAARGGAPAALARAARRDGAGLLRGQDGAGPAAGRAWRPAQGERLEQRARADRYRASAASGASPTICARRCWTISVCSPRCGRWSPTSAAGATSGSRSPRPPPCPPLSKEAELALFRALQEALSNVRRHAVARERRGRRSPSSAAACACSRCATTGEGRPTRRPSGSSGPVTWGSRACASGSARSGGSVRFGGGRRARARRSRSWCPVGAGRRGA